MDHPDIVIPARPARKMCGGVSDMTFWRWLNNKEMNFPKPIYIAGRRYWRVSELTEWLEGRAAARAAE